MTPLWAGKKAHTYLDTIETCKKNSLKAICETVEEWTKPKLDKIAALLVKNYKSRKQDILKVHHRSEETCRCNLECKTKKKFPYKEGDTKYTLSKYISS